MDQVERQWKAANVGTDKVNTWQKVARHLVRKNSIPFDRQNQSQPHNFMHNKLLVADQIVVTGSFNLSNHAMGNAENVLLIRDAAIAELFVKYIQRLKGDRERTHGCTVMQSKSGSWRCRIAGMPGSDRRLGKDVHEVASRLRSPGSIRIMTAPSISMKPRRPPPICSTGSTLTGMARSASRNCRAD
jgi:phosphatidylserine/phosphatidylglycerophosphate/cardiolipin synthase-like enzyme